MNDKQKIQKALKKHPNDHCLLARLSNVYYEKRQYKKSLKYIKQAKKIMPECPFVLWHYAGTLEELGKTKKSIKIYENLIKEGTTNKRKGPCWEDKKWTESLLTDCIFRLARLKDPTLFIIHTALVNYGVKSIYKTKNSVKTSMKKLIKCTVRRLKQTISTQELIKCALR